MSNVVVPCVCKKNKNFARKIMFKYNLEEQLRVSFFMFKKSVHCCVSF